MDAWRAQLPQPTRDQMLGTTHQENRMMVEFGNDTPESWDGLEAEWRRKQKPEFAPLLEDDSWSPQRKGWLENKLRSGRIFKNLTEANEAYLKSSGSKLPAGESGPFESQIGSEERSRLDSANTADGSMFEVNSADGVGQDSGFLSNYIHVKTIGQGFFALVTHYKEKGTGRDVAVKQPKDEKYAHRFDREIRIMQALAGHPNIIKLIDYECGNGTYRHITLKADTNLYKYIKRKNSTLTLQQRIAIFDQVLAAVSYAHSKNILHRDIAPTNVLVFEDEHVEACDFEWVRILARSQTTQLQ